MLLAHVCFVAPVTIPGTRGGARREAQVSRPGLGHVDEIRLVPVCGAALVRVSSGAEIVYYPLASVLSMTPIAALVASADEGESSKRRRAEVS